MYTPSLFGNVSIAYQKENKEKRYQKHRYSTVDLMRQNYFLLCDNCFWMASTMPALSSACLNRYKKCPVCVNMINRFLICSYRL